MNKAIFFDRDGVLVQSFSEDGKDDRGPRSIKELVVHSWCHESLREAKTRGFLLICLTNQPEIQRGLTSFDDQFEINEEVRFELELTGVYMCIHDNRDECSCRKPKPGMIYAAAYDHEINLSQSFLIGDRRKDVDAATNAGVTPFLIEKNSKVLLHAVRQICDI